MNLLLWLQIQPEIFIAIIFLIGLCVGSFLNVVVHRLPKILEAQWQNKPLKNYTLSKPSSHCPNCKHSIAAWQNIPVMSYLVLRGKCKHCNIHIPIRYMLLELSTGLLSGFIAYHLGVTWLCIAALLFTWTLIALIIIDLEHQILPDNITLPLLWLGLSFNLFGIITSLHSAVIGAIIGYLSLWCVVHLYRLITGKLAMGYGDFKLLAAIGAWCGWQVLPLVIIGSSILGTVVGLSYLLSTRQKTSTPIAFGPYLAIMGWLALMIHPWFIQWFALYLG